MVATPLDAWTKHLMPRGITLAALLMLAACQRPAPPAAPAAGSAEASGPSAADRARAAAETLGQVGPGMGSAEPIEVTDIAPPSPAVIITAGILGYTEPCGCTLDIMLGAIDRVTGFTLAARALATDSLVLDAGNILFEHESIAPEALGQELRKTQVLMAAHRTMGTFATVPGIMDLANGVSFYLETIATTDMVVLSANLQGTGELPLGVPHITAPLGGETLGIIGAVDASLYAARTDVVATDARPAVEASLEALREAGATTTLLLFQGNLAAARAQFEGITGLDFIVIGYQPRHTDEVTRVGSAWVLESYDQGRAVGRLKLVAHDTTSAWENARSGSAGELERIDRLIAGIEERIAGIPPNADGTEAEIVVAQRARIADLQAQRAAMSGEVTFPEVGRAFFFDPVDMEPGYPTHPPITAEMVAYNEELRTINMAQVDTPIPVAEGQPSYVGDHECARCHTVEHEFWLTTQHSHAIETLRLRGKDFDRSCIGCHVTGWQQPGGSVFGHTEDLENVQCEQCHGPGSLHITNPLLNNVPGGVHTEVPETTCTGCHNSEHSPRFDYTTYLGRVVGPGHGAP